MPRTWQGTGSFAGGRGPQKNHLLGPWDTPLHSQTLPLTIRRSSVSAPPWKPAPGASSGRSPKRYLDVRPASGSRDTKMNVSGTANRPPNSVSFSPRSPSFIETSLRSCFPNRNYTFQSPLHSMGPCDHFSTTEGEQKE